MSETGEPAPRGFALSGVARGGTLNLLGAACNQLCLFAIITVIARGLGTRAVGTYTLSWALFTIVGMIALWGFQAALNRFVAIHLARGDAGRVRGTVRFGICTSVGLSVGLAVAVVALANPLADVFSNPHLATDFRLVALALPGATLRDASLAATQGWRSQRAFALVGWVYEPLLRLTLTAVAVAAGWGVTGALAAIPIGAWSAALLAVIALRRRLRGLPAKAPTADVGEILRFSTGAWGTVIASVGLLWADTLILGAIGTAQQLGVYNVATRIVNLAVFVMVPLNASLGPQLAHLLDRDERGLLAQAYTATTRWMMSLSLPAFVLLLVFPRDLLHLFGSAYVAGAWVTVILAIGQFLNAATGPCGNLQTAGGHVGLNMINNIVTLVLNIGLNVALIPHFGINGAAFAWSISLAVINIARVVQNRMLFGVVPFDRSTIKVFAAGLVAAAVAVAVRLTLAGVLTQLIAGAVCASLAFVAALWAFGFEDDDRAAVRSVLGRGSRSVETPALAQGSSAAR